MSGYPTGLDAHHWSCQCKLCLQRDKEKADQPPTTGEPTDSEFLRKLALSLDALWDDVGTVIMTKQSVSKGTARLRDIADRLAEEKS